MKQIGTLVRSAQSQLQETSHQQLSQTGTNIVLSKDQNDFLLKYNPSEQVRYVENFEDRMFIGDAPTIIGVDKELSRGTSVSWIMAQLHDLNEFAGVSNKMTDMQIKDLANRIHCEYGYLKVTELMWFFHKFKSGSFGRFYGTVDPMIIANALIDFSSIRIQMRNKYENILRKKEEASRLPKEVTTYEEFKKLRDADPEEWHRRYIESESNK